MILGQCSYLRFIIISLDNMHFETGCFWRLLGCQLSSCPCLCLQPSRIWASESRNKVSILPGQYQSDTNTSTGINTIDIWITSTQTQTLLQQTAYSWKSVFGLAFLSIARHCVGYSVAHYFFLRGYVLPVGWWWWGVLCCVYMLGDTAPGGGLPSIHNCLLCRPCQSAPSAAKYLECSPRWSSGGKTIRPSRAVSKSQSRKTNQAEVRLFVRCCVAAVEARRRRTDSPARQ